MTASERLLVLGASLMLIGVTAYVLAGMGLVVK